MAFSNQEAAGLQPSNKSQSTLTKTSSNSVSTPSQIDSFSPPQKSSPTAEAIEVEKSTELFHEGNDKPAPRPDHPPIGLIPPMPMPDDSVELPKTKETGKGIISGSEVKPTNKSPVKVPAVDNQFHPNENFNNIDSEQ